MTPGGMPRDAWLGLSADLIERFIDVHGVQEHLSQDARRSWQATLLALDGWLQQTRGYTLVAATARDLEAFLASDPARGVQQPALVCLKGFYRYARRVGCRDDDPARVLADTSHPECGRVHSGTAAGDCLPGEDDAETCRVVMIAAERIHLCPAESTPRDEGQTLTDGSVSVMAVKDTMERQLRKAFAQGHLQVHYQPKIRLADGTLQGVEALLRWRSDSGWVAPSVFVPLLEDTGMILDVGTWLFQRTAADAVYWREQGTQIGSIAINVSALQLQKSGFLEWVLEIADDWRRCGASLQLELTESALLPEPQSMVAAMDALAAADVKFALDDFGMGYSSLDLLMQLPVSYVKIDRGFISRMGSHPKATTVVDAIIKLAHTLRLETIAEGIETKEQLEWLARLRCDVGQGHYFCGALDREQMLAWLRQHCDEEAGRHLPQPGRTQFVGQFSDRV